MSLPRNISRFYSSFNSYSEFKRILDDPTLNPLEEMTRLDVQSIINNVRRWSNDVDWYGTTDYEDVLSDKKVFLYPEITRRASELSKDVSSKVNFGDSFKKSKLISDSMPIGVFNFSLASKTLYKDFEFYCEFYKMVVSGDYVTKENDKYYYQHPESNEKHECIIRDKINPVNGKPIFRSKTKKVYQRRDQKSMSRKVDLFVPVGGNGQETSLSFAYRVLPSIIVANILESSGVKTRIHANVSEGSPSDVLNRRQNLFVTIKLKDYGEKINFNRILLVVGDARVYRYDMWKYIAKLYNYTGYPTRSQASGSVISGERLNTAFEEYKAYKLCENIKYKPTSTNDAIRKLHSEAHLKKSTINFNSWMMSNIFLPLSGTSETYLPLALNEVVALLCITDAIYTKNFNQTINNTVKSVNDLIDKQLMNNTQRVNRGWFNVNVLPRMYEYSEKNREQKNKFIEALDNYNF